MRRLYPQKYTKRLRNVLYHVVFSVPRALEWFYMCWSVERCLSMGTTSISSDKGSLRDVSEYLSLCHKVGRATQHIAY